MPNIATLLKEEIVRLSRKEVRSQVDPTKRSTTQLRRDVASLKRQVTLLERQIALLSRKSLGAKSTAKPDASSKPTRFSAKGLQAQRSRLGLSQTEFGKLLGVSSQSIYNWESDRARPRPELIAKLVALRSLGKREVAARLERLNGPKG